jgi:hypothetical protein
VNARRAALLAVVVAAVALAGAAIVLHVWYHREAPPLDESGPGRASGRVSVVTLVHIWRMPDPANDAVDVRVAPTTAGG